MDNSEKAKRKEIVDTHLIFEEKRNQLIEDIEESCRKLNSLGLAVNFDIDHKTLDFNLENLNHD